MRYHTLATAVAGLVTTAAAYEAGEGSWMPATQTQYLPPVAGFTLRPTPALKMPRAGLPLRRDDDDDDDDDDNDHNGKITKGTATTTASGSGSITSPPSRPSNTCGWDKSGGGFYACSNSKAACQYTNGVAGCCSGDGCKKIPKKCVAQNNKCDGDDDGTLCCHHSSAPACYTWLISTSTAGSQQTYSLLACTDKPGTGTLLPTDPASATTSKASSSSGSSSSGGSGKSNTGAIVGGVIGGLVVLLGIAAFAFYVMKQKRLGRAESAAAARKERDNQLDRDSWTDAQDVAKTRGDGSAGALGYGLVGAVPKRKEVGGGAASPDMQERSMAAIGAYSTSPATTDREGTASPNGHLAYSVSSVSNTASQSGTGYVSNLSPVPPLEGVVEAPDTGVRESDAPVEVAGTTVTRETMQNRAELP